MAPVDFRHLYALQDRVLEAVHRSETSLYLTGGTCLSRFYLEKRYSEDLDLFTNDPALYRDDVRRTQDRLRSSGLPVSVSVDSRDFVRLVVASALQVDLVNDRVSRYGEVQRSPQGYRIDNLLNILANKLTAIVGRDEPKDVFDTYLVARIARFEWSEAIRIADAKIAVDREVLELRLRSFPIQLLDSLSVSDAHFLSSLRADYPALVDDIVNERPNRFPPWEG